MEYLPLGNLKVSEIGFGTWQICGEWATTNDENILDAIGKARELGVNLIDTAEAYGDGHSETVVARAIKELGRDRFTIATKVAPPHTRYDDLLKACDASIKRLGVKEIDLYQVHWPDPWEQVPLKPTMKALEKLQTEGKTKQIGVSNFAARDLEEARTYLSKTDIISNQVRYNLVQREIEDGIIPYCKKNKITILAWSPLAQGALTGRYTSENRPKDIARINSRLFSEHNMVEIDKLLKLLSLIADRHRKTMVQVALNWLMKDSFVIPIPGATSIKQAEENVGATGWRLSSEELEEIEQLLCELKIEYYP
jgi:aryl-alcohol dehydrogenase-like predicted oxidoreductase